MVSKVPEVLEFFDLITKKRFKTKEFEITTVKGKGGITRKAAVAISPSGKKVFMFIKK